MMIHIDKPLDVKMGLFWKKKTDQPNKMVTASVALHAKEMEGHQGRSGVFHLGGSKVIREARWGVGRLRTGNSPTRIGISPIKIWISPIKIGISPIKIGISPTIWPKWCASDRLDLDHLAGRNCKPRLLLDNSEDHRALVLEPQKTAICKGKSSFKHFFWGFLIVRRASTHSTIYDLWPPHAFPHVPEFL